MAGENSGTDNPLSQGSDPHSVETAAADFSAMISGEAEERPVRERAPKKEPQSSEPEGEGDAGERTERQPAKRERPEPSDGDDDQEDRASKRDPILDGDEPEDKGDGEDDDNPKDDDETDEDESEDEPDDEDSFLDAKHTVTVNGQEVEVSGREALQGYMRQADYTQAQQRNAREYQEIETFAEESVQHRAQALDLFQQTTALLEALQPTKEDMEWLKANKPDDYIKATEHWNGLLEKARGIYGTRNQLAEGAQKQSEVRDAKYYETQERKLIEKLPALRDEKKAEHFRSSIMQYGLANGYTEEELRTSAVDHRDLITLYKAAKYDESQRSIRAAGKQAKKADPRPSGDGRARAPSKGPRSAQRNADRRHQRNGSVQSAADAFAEMIRGESR